MGFFRRKESPTKQTFVWSPQPNFNIQTGVKRPAQPSTECKTLGGQVRYPNPAKPPQSKIPPACTILPGCAIHPQSMDVSTSISFQTSDMMFSKPFGAASTTTAFGSFGSPQPNANPFAQNQLFNKTPSTTGGFGATQTTFGQQAGTSLFTGQQGQTNVFQNANTPSFGATPTSQTGFGTLFGQQQQQQPSTSGLFGTSSFGQQNKPSAFGFGTPQTQSGIFGQQQAPGQTQASSLFQPSTSTNIFGQSTSFGGTGQTGTVFKFSPVTGTDTMQKSGIATSISTKHHCITCMKEYESKSLEELRYEDYLANRKGPQQQSGFGATPFGAPVSSAPSLFGQADNKTVFGQTTGFGQTTSTFGQTTGFGMQNQPNATSSLFGKPTTGFGVASTGGNTFGFGTNTTTNVPFGASQQTKPFGATTQPLFAATTPQQPSGFGTGIFGQTGTQSTAGSSLFGKPAQTATAPAQGFSFPQPTTTTSSLFQQPKMGFPMFGQTTTSTPNYGQTSSFGQPQSTFATGSALGKPVGSTFPVTQGFGANFTGGQQNATPSLFASTQQKPGGFFDSGGGLFMGRSLQQPTTSGFGMQQQQLPIAPFPTADSAESVLLVANTQFPFSPHLSGLIPITKADTSTYATNRQDINTILDQNRVTTKTPTLKLRPITRGQKTGLFTEEEDLFKNYMMNTNRRLIVKKDSDDSSIFNDPREEIPVTVVQLRKFFDERARASEATKEADNEEHLAAVRSRSSAALAQAINDKDTKESSTTNDEDVPPVEEPKPEEEPVHHPCGIVLTRPEYFTVPPLSEIEQYKNEDGSCLVKGFTVGRIGYGNVYFPDVMDVSNLNLDDIVFFRFKEVTVYPDSYSNKPPVGQGLNRRAQITLDHVYPTVHGQQVKDLDKLIELGYIENLKESCARQGCKFLEYRVESGSWVFESKHFTTYSVDFHDDYGTPPKRKQEKTTQSEDGVNAGLGANLVSAQNLGNGQQAENSISDSLVLPISTHSLVLPLSTPISEQNMATGIHNQIAALFEGHRAAYSDLSEQQAAKDADQNISLAAASSIADRQVCPPPKLSVLSRRFGIVPPEKSLLTRVRSCKQMNIFKGRSFKCGWMTGLKHITVGDAVLIGRHSSDILDIRNVCLEKPSETPTSDFIHQALMILNSEVTCDFDKNKCPTLKVNIGTNYLLKQTALFKKLQDCPNLNGNVKYFCNIWELCSALWEPLIAENDLRRDYVSKWLKKVVARPTIDPSVPLSDNMSFKELTSTVWELLSTNCVNEAAELLMTNRCPQLSLLVSQLPSISSVQELIVEQLQFWHISMTEEFIPTEMEKLYLLLSGYAVGDEYNICENLDWKRAFGMHLWYVCPAHAPLKEVVKLYRESFDTSEPYAVRPLPPYAEGDRYVKSNDILYEILQLYTSNVYVLNHLLDPGTHTADKLDYRMSWLLLQLFKSLQIGVIDDVSENMIIDSLSNQLENMDEWKWAIYVLTFMKDNKLKEQKITRILERNLTLDINKETDKIDDTLVRMIKIPPSWIHKVKAYKAEFNRQHWLSYTHFAHAGMYCKSNDIFVEHLLPQLVIDKQFDELKLAIKPLEPYQKDIVSWRYEIGLVLDFLELEKKFEDIGEDADIKLLHGFILTLVRRFSSFPQKNVTQKFCIAELSKVCASWQRKLVEKSKDPVFVDSFVEVMDNLVMPPDDVFIEAFYYMRKIAELA